MSGITCLVCNRSFKGKQYFIQHIGYKKNLKCRIAFQQHLRGLSPKATFTPSPKEAKRLKLTEDGSVVHKPVRRELIMQDCPTKQPAQQAQQQQQQQELQFADNDDEFVVDNDDGYQPLDDGDEEDIFPPDGDVPYAPMEAEPLPNIANNQPDHPDKSKIKDEFQQYVEFSKQNRSWMDADMQAGVELLHILHQNGAVSLYDRLLEWHLAHSEAKKRITKTHLVEKLRKRYNMEKCKPYLLRVTLPSSGVKCRIPCHDAWAMVQDLLTDPRIIPEDYLWFNGDPLGHPPAEWMELRDINDGLAYRKTYEELILPQQYTNCGRRRVLLPVIGYMDGCVTGFNENLAIEIFKFTLGLFNSKARDKGYTWRNLGAVPQYQKVKAKAVENLEKSGHVEAKGYLSASDSEDDNTPNGGLFTREFDRGPYIDSSDDEAEMCDIPLPETESQDLHVILQVIMSGMKKIFDTRGFDWDVYHNGERIRLFFVPFLMFIKGDTVEHDKHTGHYGSRTRGVKCLCRYCICPTEEFDNPYADYPRKSPQMMTDLVRKGDMDGLKNISQQFIFNNWYEFLFGLHNLLGIHGACPMELLHWIQLGWYKYDRVTLFDLTGQYSELSRKINIIASQMGYLFQRQSDRGYPRTKFTKGIQKGTLMAHEMTGLMLVLVCTLRSSDGRQAILDSNCENFPNQEAISGWVMMLELQLEFEAYLKLPTMNVATVIRLRTKVRELMGIIKVVGRREKGMGYKTNNFHATKHVPDDILMFGPPHTTNTKSSEMHHKSDKKSAKSTQKRPASFDMQCTERIEERRILEFAMEELKGRPKWDYFVGFSREDQLKSDRLVQKSNKIGASSPNKPITYPKLTGVQSIFEYDEVDGYGYKVLSSMKRKNRYRYPQFIVDVVANLTEELADYVGSLTVFSEILLSESQRFRAAPFYLGKPWYDWAMSRVGEQIEGFEQRVVPVQIRGFVDLSFLPGQNTTPYAPGVYMIAEPTVLNPDAFEIGLSDLFVPFLKQEGQFTPNRIEILPVTNIVSTACVVPDVGHPNKRAFLRVRPVTEWASLFKNWVHTGHSMDHPEPPIGE